MTQNGVEEGEQRVDAVERRPARAAVKGKGEAIPLNHGIEGAKISERRFTLMAAQNRYFVGGCCAPGDVGEARLAALQLTARSFFHAITLIAPRAAQPRPLVGRLVGPEAAPALHPTQATVTHPQLGV